MDEFATIQLWSQCSQCNQYPQSHYGKVKNCLGNETCLVPLRLADLAHGYGKKRDILINSEKVRKEMTRLVEEFDSEKGMMVSMVVGAGWR